MSIQWVLCSLLISSLLAFPAAASEPTADPMFRGSESANQHDIDGERFQIRVDRHVFRGEKKATTRNYTLKQRNELDKLEIRIHEYLRKPENQEILRLAKADGLNLIIIDPASPDGSSAFNVTTDQPGLYVQAVFDSKGSLAHVSEAEVNKQLNQGLVEVRRMISNLNTLQQLVAELRADLKVMADEARKAQDSTGEQKAVAGTPLPPGVDAGGESRAVQLKEGESARGSAATKSAGTASKSISLE